MNYLIEIIVLILTIASSRWQAWWFDVKQQKIVKWHWAAAYGLLIWISWTITHDWCLTAALLLQRMVFFSPMLNYWRIPRRALFYTNPIWSKKTGSSWLDKIWGNWYPYIMLTCLLLYIIIQFKL